MKRGLMVALALLALGLCSLPAFAKAPETVLLLISRENGRNPELMLTMEVGVMLNLLKQAGFRVKVSAPSEREITGTISSLKPDLKNSEVRLADYAGFVLPCMAQPTGAEGVAPEFIKLVQQITATGKPVAAMMSSIDILRKAGVLEGRTIAAQNSRPPCVVDRNLVTSMMCPYMAQEMGEKDAVADVMRAFIGLLRAKSQ
jgi:putative intracellular protease/amidase